jgi:hypothetical protein
LLFGRLSSGGTVRVDLVDGKRAFSYPTPALPPKRAEGAGDDRDSGPEHPPEGPQDGSAGGPKVPETVP